MNLAFAKIYEFDFSKKKFINIWLAQVWGTIYITSEFNFYEKTETLLLQFCVIIYVTSEFHFYEKTKTLLVQFGK